jgi:hypothetical protein
MAHVWGGVNRLSFMWAVLGWAPRRAHHQEIPMTAELRTFVDIDATPERVWEVLTDVPAWPQWNQFITSAEGTFVVGRRLSLSIPPLNALLRMTLRLTVLEVTPCRRLRFRLRLARLALPGLFDADHTLTITSHGGGGVRLWEDARFRGLLVPLLTRYLNRDKLPAFNATNAALKTRIEGRRPTPPK